MATRRKTYDGAARDLLALVTRNIDGWDGEGPQPWAEIEALGIMLRREGETVEEWTDRIAATIDMAGMLAAALTDALARALGSPVADTWELVATTIIPGLDRLAEGP